jgi:hypothetical protein
MSQEAIYKKILQRLIIICPSLFIKYARECLHTQFTFYEKFSNLGKENRGLCNPILLTVMY